MVKRKERGGGWWVGLFPPSSSLFSLTLNQIWVNDREPVTVTRPNKTAELQVNPLHPNISLHILHTVLYTFP